MFVIYVSVIVMGKNKAQVKLEGWPTETAIA